MFLGYDNKEKRKQYLREYRKRNRKKLYKQHKEWREKNGGYSKEYCQEYYQKNKKRYKEYNQKRRKKYRDGKLAGTAGIGRKYEKIALSLLKGSVDCNKDCFSGKWDIEWNGYKIDVKMRNLSKRGCWGFTAKSQPKADYYLLFCIQDKEIVKILFVPKLVFKTSLSIRNNDKYDKFRVFIGQCQ